MKTVEYYRDNPIAYMEEVLSLELLPWQKKMLIALFKSNRSVVMCGGSRLNGKLAFQMAVKSYRDAMEHLTKTIKGDNKK